MRFRYTGQDNDNNEDQSLPDQRRPVVASSATGLLRSSALFLGADRLLGPFYIGYGFAADVSRSVYLFLRHP